jgi:hypothetical protein
MDRPRKRHLDRSRAVLSRDAVERPLYFVFACLTLVLYSNSKTAKTTLTIETTTHFRHKAIRINL